MNATKCRTDGNQIPTCVCIMCIHPLFSVSNRVIHTIRSHMRALHHRVHSYSIIIIIETYRRYVLVLAKARELQRTTRSMCLCEFVLQTQNRAATVGNNNRHIILPIHWLCWVLPSMNKWSLIAVWQFIHFRSATRLTLSYSCAHYSPRTNTHTHWPPRYPQR